MNTVPCLCGLHRCFHDYGYLSDWLQHKRLYMKLDNLSKIQHLQNALNRYMELKDPNPRVIKAYHAEIEILKETHGEKIPRQQEPQRPQLQETGEPHEGG